MKLVFILVFSIILHLMSITYVGSSEEETEDRSPGP